MNNSFNHLSADLSYSNSQSSISNSFASNSSYFIPSCSEVNSKPIQMKELRVKELQMKESISQSHSKLTTNPSSKISSKFSSKLCSKPTDFRKHNQQPYSMKVVKEHTVLADYQNETYQFQINYNNIKSILLNSECFCKQNSCAYQCDCYQNYNCQQTQYDCSKVDCQQMKNCQQEEDMGQTNDLQYEQIDCSCEQNILKFHLFGKETLESVQPIQEVNIIQHNAQYQVFSCNWVPVPILNHLQAAKKEKNLIGQEQKHLFQEELNKYNGIRFQPVIYMQKLMGTDLSQILSLRTVDEIPIHFLVELGEQVRELHSKSIIHRDLKPANIMVSYQFHPKIIDFGVSTMNKSVTDTIVGSPLYMAPEIVLGKLYDETCDYWSIGMVLVECLVFNLGVDFSLYPAQSMRTIIELFWFIKNQLTQHYIDLQINLLENLWKQSLITSNESKNPKLFENSKFVKKSTNIETTKQFEKTNIIFVIRNLLQINPCNRKLLVLFG